MYMLKSIRYGFFIIACVFFSITKSHAGPLNSPYPPAPCLSGGVNISVNAGACTPNIAGLLSGALYPQGQKLVGTNSDDIFSGDNLLGFYVPHAGRWGMRVHYCAAQAAGACTIRNSQITIDSVSMVYLNSTTEIIHQSGDWGGGKGQATLPFSASTCFTLYDEQQIEYQASTMVTPLAMCSDAGELPETPSVCSINNGAALDVAFGELDREKIPVNAAAKVNKSVVIDCSGDASVTFKTSFQFSSVAFNGTTLVATSNNKLGVAIFYKGNLVTTGSTFTDTMQTGSNSVQLGFAVVRDGSASVSDIPTGEFTASAVMVMTQQ
ncbi:fimbrial protein [Enterobacter sp. DRP3]|nr:fimbrial protein [Enterobacter sp. DRP3]